MVCDAAARLLRKVGKGGEAGDKLTAFGRTCQCAQAFFGACAAAR